MSNTNMLGMWYKTPVAKKILSEKYYHEGEDFDAFLTRVANIFSTEELRTEVAAAIVNGDFLPAGRSLYGAGAKGKFKASMSNCYILPMPEDDLRSINKVDMESEIIYSRGGGCGVNISKLRPKGAIVKNAAKTSTGAVSFINKFDQSATAIGAHGRRAALMVGINCDHPDLEEFLNAKQNDDKIQSANLSILFTDEFMWCAKENKPFQLYFETEHERIHKEINARDFFKKFCESNHDWAEPGCIFIDTVQHNHLLSYYPEKEYKIEISNPCAEYFGNAYNSCNLGSINLYNIVKNPFTSSAIVDYKKLADLTVLGVTALDEILDYGYDMQPLDENRKCIDDWRAIGLGVFGLADMFIALGVEYGSKRSVDIVASIAAVMRSSALVTSSKLAKEKGTFGKYNWEYIKESPILKGLAIDVYNSIQKYGLRNGSLLSIAPTGSIATMIGMSGGIEPLYKTQYERTTHALEKEGKTFTVLAKSIEHFLHLQDPNKTFLPENFPYIVTAHGIKPKDRIAVQAAMQKYVDNAISSTVNMNHSATVDEVFETYMYAWESGCKGMTIFRDGCKRTSILGKDEKKPSLENGVQLDSLSPMKSKDKVELTSHKYVGHTACATNMHIHTPSLDGNVFEVFADPKGGCVTNINAITKLVSHCLRLGGKVEDIVEDLKSNVCSACTLLIHQGREDISVSCAACIGEALGKEYKRLKGTVKQEDESLLPCPECGKKAFRPEGKCGTCMNCGFNRCD